MLPNPMRFSVVCCSFLLVMVQVVANAQEATTPQRVLLVDWNKGSLASISTADGKTIASYDVDMKADGLDAVLPSPDGTRIVVAHTTPPSRTLAWDYPGTWPDGRQPKAKSRITILDSRTLKPVSTLELGWGLQKAEFRLYGGSGRWVWAEGSFSFGQSGRLYVLFPGYRSGKPNETLPAEIIAVDLNSGQVIARREFEQPVTALLPAAGKDKAVVLLGSLDFNSYDPYNSNRIDLSWLDLGKLEVVGTLRVQATKTPVFGPGGEIFVEEKFPDKTRLHIIDGSRYQEIAAMDLDGDVAEIKPREDGRAFLLTVTGKGTKGRLQSIRMGTVEATVDLTAAPRFIVQSPERNELFVVCTKAIIRLNTSLEKVGEIATEKDEPKSLVFAKNLRRAFLLYQGSSKVTTVDLQKGAALATIKTGSGVTKFLQGMEEAQARSDLMTYANSDPLHRLLRMDSKVIAEATLRGMPAVDTDVLLHPDDTFAYVLNKRTSDVTIIEQETGNSVGIVPTGGYYLRQFGPNRAAGVSDKLDLIDLTTNKKVDDPVIKSLSRLIVSPDRAFIYALGKGQLVSLDANEGKLLRSVTLAEPKRARRECAFLFLPSQSGER